MRALEGLGGRIGVPEAVAETPCAWGRRTPWQEEVSLSPVALFLFSLGVSEGDTEAGGLTGVVLAPGALGCRQGGGPLSAPISRQLFFRNVCLFTCPGPHGVSCGLFCCGRHHLVP